MKKGIVTLLLAAVVGAAAAFAVVKLSSPSVQGTQVIVQDGAGQFRTVSLTETEYPDFTYAAESAVDAVVYVKVTVKDVTRTAPSSIFDFFFGYEGTPRERERVGSGSGVIIRPDGYIVTNNHVIEGASKIEVTLNNNKTFEAQLIGTDPATDVALIKIDAQGLPVVPFGDSDNLRLGEWVLAIGSPYDLRSTITAGIVSAKGRSMPNYDGEFKIESFIQTDAAVNPGNSGGALVDKAGKATLWMAVGASLVLAAHLIMAFAPQGVEFFGYLAISLLGTGYSLVPSAMWPSVPKIVPEKNLGTAYSLIYWIQNMGMLLVPVFVGRIFRETVTEPGNTVQEITAAVNAEFIFIGLGVAAIIIAALLIMSSRRHPELMIDRPNRTGDE